MTAALVVITVLAGNCQAVNEKDRGNISEEAKRIRGDVSEEIANVIRFAVTKNNG